MIRLVFVSTLAYNYFFPGKIKQAGGHTRIYNLSKAFAKVSGYKVYCITGDFGQDDIIEKDGVTLVKAPIDNPFSFLQVVFILRKIKPDILVDFCASPRLFLYYMIKIFIRMKYVFLTCCDNDVNGDYQKAENNFFHFLYVRGLKKADRIIAQVPKHRRLLLQNYYMDSELVLSPYFKITNDTPSDKDIVLWVGRAAYYKGPDVFVALAENFPEQKFVMICNKSDYDKGFMGDINQGIHIPENLEFYEYVPYPEMDVFYRRAKFIVNTSDYEGFLFSFIEAAKNYTPILSLNSDPNEMLSMHNAGYVCNGSKKILYVRCRQMLLDNDKTKRIGKNAFDYAFKYHRLELAVDQFDRIFKSIGQDNLK